MAFFLEEALFWKRKKKKERYFWIKFAGGGASVIGEKTEDIKMNAKLISVDGCAKLEIESQSFDLYKVTSTPTLLGSKSSFTWCLLRKVETSDIFTTLPVDEANVMKIYLYIRSQLNLK